MEGFTTELERVLSLIGGAARFTIEEKDSLKNAIRPENRDSKKGMCATKKKRPQLASAA